MATNFATTAAIGQQWKTRGGAVVRITADRGDFAVNGWRWATSNDELVHEDDGRVCFTPGGEHKNDLMELVGDGHASK